MDHTNEELVNLAVVEKKHYDTRSMNIPKQRIYWPHIFVDRASVELVQVDPGRDCDF